MKRFSKYSFESLQRHTTVADPDLQEGGEGGWGGGVHPDPEIRVRGPVSKKRSATVQENAKIANFK